ncbi:MAG: adenylyl-sulfate reductase subunit alpha [Deltaproteobacteria bacterium]|jgi:adenylylsulfate reductase subunit A|nr:adenylyl-sulfate reductase subunit alpha [Deltaproteobacteria bacterium]
MRFDVETLKAQVAIVGGGAAGSAAAIRLAARGFKVILVEKAGLERSGCLAPGVNALNAYVGRGKTPQDYVDYAMADAHGVARPDLLLSMAQRLNDQAKWLQSIGLAIHLDAQGRFLERSWRNIQVNGENIKPKIAAQVRAQSNVTILERTVGSHFLVTDNQIQGLVAFQTRAPKIILIRAAAVICATGGAAGLYRPHNPHGCQNRVWYPPFNAGGGLAMGILAGAEMTTLEMRFVALRVRDTFAPTGTLALGVGAEQLNAQGAPYEAPYGRSTSQRVLALRRQTQLGLGPCYLSAAANRDSRERVYRAYLNMCPAQTLKFLEEDADGLTQDERILTVEIGASEPYVQGGHTAGGYWVDTDRQSTVNGLWAIGDVAGGCPQKYVTGALAEAELAAESVATFLSQPTNNLSSGHHASLSGELNLDPDEKRAIEELNKHFTNPPSPYQAQDLLQALQKTLDLYAGGVSADYRYSRAQLMEAEKRLERLFPLANALKADTSADLLGIWELKERLVVARSLLAHLAARKETRWPGFGEYLDHPEVDGSLGFINSRFLAGRVQIIQRPFSPKERYGRLD